MNVLGLKGFSSLGRIDKFFTRGCFPSKFNWRARDVDFVLAEYYRQYGSEPYLAICYSDGGVIGHRLLLSDRNCLGLIASAASFPLDLDVYYSTSSPKPVLILNNAKDLTGMGKRSLEALDFYIEIRFPVVYRITTSATWHGHDFAPGLRDMEEWALENFNFQLPIRRLS
jgi:hypothetical protein